MERHYDVLICYDPRDAKWIREYLLPQLDTFGVSYAVDFNDFIPGKTISSELDRLHSVSRHTIIVLSPHGLSSHLTAFALQLNQYYAADEPQDEVLLLRRGRCSIPAGLSTFPVIDIDGATSQAGILELHKRLFLNSQPLGTYPIFGEIAIASVDLPEGYSGKCYVADLTIGNPGHALIVYDTIVLTFATTGPLGSGLNVARSILLGSTDGQFHLAPTYYHEDVFSARRRIGALYKDRTWDAHTLDPLRALTMEKIPFYFAPPSVSGQSVATVGLSLAVGATEISDTCYSALPPLLSLPDGGQSVRKRITLVNLKHLPSLSGVTDLDIVEKIMGRARSYCTDSELMRITPRFITRHSVGENIFHSCADWHFVFASRQRALSFTLRSIDPTWINESETEPIADNPGPCLPLSVLTQIRLDCRIAYLVARFAEKITTADSLDFALECQILEGYPRPIWRLPFLADGRSVSVRADSGELLVFSEERWQTLV